MIPRPEHARLSTTAATTATVPAEFTWNDSYLLGYGPMDDTHREFVEVVARLSASGLLAATAAKRASRVPRAC